jgi:hypothetical protein
MRVPGFANVENARREHSVSRVLAVFVRLLRTHALVDEGLCCRKHIVASHVSVERPSADKISNRAA